MSKNTLLRRVKNILRHVSFLQRPYSKIKISMIEKKHFKSLHSHGYEILGEAIEELKKNEIRAFCAFGSLLGVVRDNGFIASDDDIDMGLLPDAAFSWTKLESALSRCGMIKTRQFTLNGEITEQSYEKKGVQIDFFMYRIKDDRMVANVYWIDPQKEYKHEGGHSVMYRYAPMITDLITKEIHGVNVTIPKNYEAYLSMVYGANWRTPDPNFKHEDVVESEDELEAFREYF